MPTDDSRFNIAAIEDLRERTKYESWLLEAAYELSDNAIAEECRDQLIYPATGGSPVILGFASMHARIGDWRDGFLKAGAPLVLVTSFKLLDMLFEWVLEQNASNKTFRFSQKIGALDDTIQFPDLVASRPWLKDRLVNLYRNLEPLRGTIIHERHFTSSDGAVEVSSSKRGVIGSPVRLSSDDLRAFALVVVSVLRYLEGAWVLDSFREKRLRWFLDKLTQLHLLPSLNQAQPRFITVRKYLIADSPIEFDLRSIAKDALARNPDREVVFDLSIIMVWAEQDRTTAYLVPWQSIQGFSTTMSMSRQDLDQYLVGVPGDFDWAVVAKELGLSH